MKFDTSDQRRAFMRMTREEKDGILHDRLAYLSNEHAEYVKQMIALRDEITFIKRELQGIGMRAKDDTMTTSEKFESLMGKRFDWGVWFRDKVLPQVITLIVLAVLALTFGQALVKLLP